MNSWTTKNIPDQSGRRILITGATTGFGFETALALAAAGAEVFLTGRDPGEGALALSRIRAEVVLAKVHFETLDLANLVSVSDFADRFTRKHRAIDVLINNAGVMLPSQHQDNTDGFELQFGSNFLGHYALTACLLPLLRASKQPRVVNLSAMAHRSGTNFLDDQQSQLDYRRWRMVAMSMLLFAFELQRRSDAGHWNLTSNAAQPGIARTGLIAHGPTHDDGLEGVLPTLFAATAPTAARAGHYGPEGFRDLAARVKDVFVAARADADVVAAHLWDVSAQLTGAQWPTTTTTTQAIAA